MPAAPPVIQPTRYNQRYPGGILKLSEWVPSRKYAPLHSFIFVFSLVSRPKRLLLLVDLIECKTELLGELFAAIYHKRLTIVLIRKRIKKGIKTSFCITYYRAILYPNAHDVGIHIQQRT